mmetsp:Transcript_26082/g.57752  ORF Transcript_26082/g.57752 Transcript_26082/m.57752 type:complete len:219 (-) Transcript_26082:309-965(-)
MGTRVFSLLRVMTPPMGPSLHPPTNLPPIHTLGTEVRPVRLPSSALMGYPSSLSRFSSTTFTVAPNSVISKFLAFTQKGQVDWLKTMQGLVFISRSICLFTATASYSPASLAVMPCLKSATEVNCTCVCGVWHSTLKKPRPPISSVCSTAGRTGCARWDVTPAAAVAQARWKRPTEVTEDLIVSSSSVVMRPFLLQSPEKPPSMAESRPKTMAASMRA